MTGDPTRELLLYGSPTEPCSYLPGREARNLFVDPATELDPESYQALLEQGFRRSGRYVYHPWCRECRACIPCRVPVAEFRPRRSQRRNLRRNRGALELLEVPAGFSAEHFALYRRYTAARHPGGGMADADPATYLDFILCDWMETRLLEIREGGRLVGVAVTDRLPAALSAVYTFFDPGLAGRAPGVFAILSQIRMAAELGLPWLYLGYWIPGCRKMAYKQEYRPLELFASGAWRRFAAGEAIPLPGGAGVEQAAP